MVTVFRYPRGGERSFLCGGLQHHRRTCLCHPQFTRKKTTAYGSPSPKWIIFYDPPSSPVIRIEEQRKNGVFPDGDELSILTG